MTEASGCSRSGRCGSAAGTRSAAPDAVHPAVLPGRQRRPGGPDLPLRRRRPSSRARTTPPSSCPSSLLLAASFGSAALYLVEEIEGGYFDKLRAAPVSRTAHRVRPLSAEAVKSVAITRSWCSSSLPFGIRIASGPLGLRAAHRAGRGVGGRVLGVHAAHRAEDPQRGGDQLGRPRSSSRCSSSPRTSCRASC